MIDTDKIRRQGVTTNNELIALCDEIDRLRQRDRTFQSELIECTEELGKLRDQLRPRSIKDEPPPEGIKVHGWDNDDNWLSWKTPIKNSCVTYWRPYPPPPPAPPAPDKFEEWLKSEERRCGCNFTPFFVDGARAGWDAAKKDQP